MLALAQDKQKEIAFFDCHSAIDAHDVFTQLEPQELGERSMTNLKRLVTISIPVLNEAGNITPLLERLRAVAGCHPCYDFEFLFTDNASTDATFERLAEEARRDDRIRVLRFTRNFGFQTSILTNYLNANGAAAIQIDADLQDPPELFGQFLAAWEQGYKVVYGIRRSRPGKFRSEIS